MKMLFDLHTHTISSGHAYSTLQENAARAAEMGLEILGMSDHAPKMPGSTIPYFFGNLKIIPEYISGVKILKGCELNIMSIDGSVDLYGDILEGLEYTIASLHPPCIAPSENPSDNTEALINTMNNPKVNIIGHPGDPRYLIDVKKVVDCAIKTNTLLEVNNASLRPGGTREGGEKIVREIVLECKRRDYPVIFGSDAHISFEIGDYGYIYENLKSIELPEELIVNTSVENLKKFIKII